MKWLKSFPDGRGGFDSMEWDMGDVGMEYVINIFKYIFFGVFIYWVFAPLVLFLLPAENHKENRVGLIKLGIASGVILLLDYWFGGVLWLFFNSGEGEATSPPGDGVQYSRNLEIVSISMVDGDLMRRHTCS